PVRIGSHCTIAADAFVHYGVEMGDRSALGPNAFLMKGESVPAGQTWQGNPASLAPALPVTGAVFDRRSEAKPATARKRLAEQKRKARSVPWRLLPPVQHATTDRTQDSRDVLQRQVIVGPVMAPTRMVRKLHG
ncbi:MAG: hypothetical protein ABJM26_09040, partial [Anderseniella sp.]